MSDFEDSTDIAIIGMAGRFPGADNVDTFWQNLRDGVESITQFSDEDLLQAGVDPTVLKDPYYVKAGAVLEDIDKFDAAFFGLTPREAQIMDPQHRLFLETAWNAIEHGGYTPAAYQGSIGVFGGVGLSTYLLNNLYPNRDLWESMGLLPMILGNDKDSLTTRVAYFLDLTGPCYTVQTYCSTSLVAVSIACESLLGGDCDMALAGGTFITVPQKAGYYYQEGGIASPDARCRAFDAKAKGAPLGSGTAVVLLKRLEDAVADGDTIHAVIKGWAINNDGALRVGYTAPGVRGQSNVMLEAMANADVDGESISYVEAHGTGTALGDAVEFAAMVKAFSEYTDKKGFCAIGSVKTNTGHLDRAAGVTGLIKTTLALKHQLIPPSLNYEDPNPEIDFSQTPFFVNTELRPWTPPNGYPRRAGVSSFGMGGTNAHVILEEAPTLPFSPPQRPYQLLLLSARTATALDTATVNLRQTLQDQPHINMADVAYTLQVGRQPFEHRRILVSRGREDALRLLDNQLAQLPTSHQATRERPITFMFAGVGEYYINIARELYEREPVFQETVDTCCDLLQPLIHTDLRQVLYPANAPTTANASGLDLRQMLSRAAAQTAVDPDPLSQPQIGQPTAFVIAYALAKLLQSWHITPQSLIGYSLGEYVAACVAGVLSLPDALTLVAKRAQLIQTLPQGSMLVVPLAQSEIQPFLNERVNLAIINGPANCVLAGPPEAIQQVEAQLTADGIACRRINTDHALHSAMMQPILAEFTQLVRAVPLHPPQIPYLSNVTGQWITAAEATDPDYWGRHLCQTVKFDSGLAQLLQDPDRILVEIGPGQSLGSFAKQHPTCTREQLAFILPTLHHAYDQQPDIAFLLTTLGKLWLTGLPLDWDAFYGDERRQRIPLPTYPFERERYWIEPTATTFVTAPRQQETMGKKADIADWFYEPVWENWPLLDPQPHTHNSWLVFVDQESWSQHLSQHLQQQGTAIIEVHSGEQFAQLADNVFTIRPDVLADYQALFKALDTIPAHVAHLWSWQLPASDLSDKNHFHAAQRRGFYSLLCLAQALGSQRFDHTIDLAVLTNKLQPIGSDIPQPEQATLLGLCRVIPQEYQGIRCRVIDAALPADAPPEEAAILAPLAQELLAETADPAVAYRAGDRYIQQFVPKRLTTSPTPAQLRPGGVYLITGGLGSIGLLLAQHLAQQLQAKLVLTSRTGLPPRDTWANWLASHPAADATSVKIGKVQALEAFGAEVAVMVADVTDVAQMQTAVEDTITRFGTLHGVIHAAGLTTLDMFKGIQDMDRQTCEAHFQSKVYGLYTLHQVLADKEIDFCFLFSSLSAILGGLGFAPYAAANAFMDTYTHAHTRTSNTNWISMDWDTWQFVVMQIGNVASEATTVSAFEMTPDEGIRAFELALASGRPHIVNSTGDLSERIRQWVMLEALKPTAVNQTTHARPALNTTYTAANTEVEKQITAIWQDILGIDGIGIHDNFFDLGGNSLIGLQIVGRIKKELEIQIPAIALFEAPTITALARYLQPDTPAEEDTEQTTLIARRRHARKNVDNQGIAVIAMNGRFPGARDVATFWQNLCDEKETISFFTDEELREAGFDQSLLDQPNYVKARPVLDDIDQFDATFFGYSPREAEVMDPQHRFFLECAWEALELAGYSSEQYRGLIGVFAGTNISTYLLSWYSDPKMQEEVNLYQVVIGSDKDSLPTTVSYKLNLKGPSFAVQTFCSTSLVATHLACQSLLNGECDMALAGGVSIRVPAKQGYLYNPGGMESSDGHCRTFDAKADGSLFGDGVGVVILKRLADALKDGDTIHAVIKGSAVNNDGSLKVGYTAPSVAGQADAVLMALEHGGIDPETIGYIEAHGTATELGDPIEVASLTRAFRAHTDKKQYCAIGSVKTNMGHLDRAAGVTGLIKAILAVKHGFIPRNLHYEAPNPEIDFDNSPFYVAAQAIQWQRQNGTPRRAGVNSLGMGGTNAHVIVEEPPLVSPSGPSRSQQLLLLSARTEVALDAATTNLAHYLREHPDVNLADVAYTLQVGRHTFEHRRTAVCTDTTDALAVLESQNPQRLLSSYQPHINRSVAFMFPGVGDHYLHMAQELYENEVIFQEIVDQCCQQLQPYLGVPIRDLLYPEETPTPANNGVDLRAMLKRNGNTGDPTDSPLHETAVAQPLVFVIEYALAYLLMTWGFRPQALVGYSLGEYVAACISGVLSLTDALTLVAERAQMIQSLPPGHMIAVSATEETIQSFLSDDISLAAHNGQTTFVLAGAPEAVDHLKAQLTERQISFRPLETSHAFHSHMMASLVEPLTTLARSITLNPPRIPYLSNVTGTWITAEQATDPGYWAQHMCQPVRFYDALNELLADKEQILLEVGPGQSLGSFAKQHPTCSREQIPLILPTMRAAYDRQSDLAYLLRTVGKTWMLGLELNWRGFYEAETRHRLPLTTYPFQHQRFWVEASQNHFGQHTQAGHGETLAEIISSLPRQEVENWFYLPSWKQSPPQLPDEQIETGTCWLLFVDDCGLHEKIGHWLKAHQQQIITVQPGSSFQQITSTHFSLRPRERADYEALLRALHQQGLEPAKVVHMWSVTADNPTTPTEATLTQTLDLGFYSLMGLAQALNERLITCDLSIISTQVQSVTGSERLSPEKATIIGPCRVVPLEYTNIACRAIDITLLPHDHWQAEIQLDNLIGELTAAVTDSAIALRGHHRWVQSFEPMAIPAARKEQSPSLRPQGVYLITGGLGGIGLAMATHLAQTVSARLVLMGRSGLPDRSEWDHIIATQGSETGTGWKIAQVRQLEAAGAEVLVVAADVTDEAQVQTAVQQAIARFGTIHGVVHAAGVPGIGLIQLKTPEMAADVLAPKLQGTLFLERALKEVELDFLALFSSITSVTGGGPGQIDYCAANAFLDAYALQHMGQKRLTTSIDWNEWQWNAWEAGLDGFNSEVQTFFRENRKRFGIKFDEGSDAFHRVLSRRLPHVVVSPQDFRTFAAASKLFTIKTVLNWGQVPAENRAKYPRPVLGTSYVAPSGETEEKIAAVWSDILGIEEIGSQDNFFDLGGNSLIGLDLVARLRKTLDKDTIPTHILYEASTVSALAAFVTDDQQKSTAMIAERLARGEERRQRFKNRRRSTPTRRN